jgi:choline dehydrogenase-like flavoprotein
MPRSGFRHHRLSSAGSAMAYRLSEDGKYSVIVIEFSGTDIGPLIRCRQRCRSRST